MRACFVGLGYIGLPTAIIAATEGNVEVTGVDIDPRVVEMTNSGKLHIVEPGMAEKLREAVGSGKLKAFTSPRQADAFFIVVPTPFKGNHLPDISYVEAATRSVIPFLREGSLFIIESTSPVGTTEKMAGIIFSLRPELKGKIHIAYCPERVLPGNVAYELVHNDRVIGGLDPESAEAAAAFYARFVKGQLHRTNARTAEMCKLTENSSRDVQIAFANELSVICDKAGINVWELISLANRHPRVNILRPGCGVGGHCIAVDPYFISSSYPGEARIIALAREVNNGKARWSADRVAAAILKFEAGHHRAPVVALMGLAFKPDIDDLRESPAMEIARSLTADYAGKAEFPIVEPNIESHPQFTLTPCGEAFSRADIVVYLTGHTPFRQLPANRENKQIIDFCGITSQFV